MATVNEITRSFVSHVDPNGPFPNFKITELLRALSLVDRCLLDSRILLRIIFWGVGRILESYANPRLRLWFA